MITIVNSRNLLSMAANHCPRRHSNSRKENQGVVEELLFGLWFRWGIAFLLALGFAHLHTFFCIVCMHDNLLSDFLDKNTGLEFVLFWFCRPQINTVGAKKENLINITFWSTLSSLSIFSSTKMSVQQEDQESSSAIKTPETTPSSPVPVLFQDILSGTKTTVTLRELWSLVSDTNHEELWQSQQQPWRTIQMTKEQDGNLSLNVTFLEWGFLAASHTWCHQDEFDKLEADAKEYDPTHAPFPKDKPIDDLDGHGYDMVCYRCNYLVQSDDEPQVFLCYLLKRLFETYGFEK